MAVPEIRMLEEQLKKKGLIDIRKRLDAVVRLGDFSTENVGLDTKLKAVSLLEAAASDENKLVRKQAVAALGGFEGNAIPALKRIIKDMRGYADVKPTAVDALGGMKNPGVVEALVDALADAGHDLKIQAVRIFGKRRDVQAIPVLAGSLKSGSALMRQHSASSLDKIHEEVKDREVVDERARVLKLVYPHFTKKEIEEAIGREETQAHEIMHYALTNALEKKIATSEAARRLVEEARDYVELMKISEEKQE